MPKKLLVEFTCSRCTRVWYEPYEPGGPEPQTSAFIATLKSPLEEKPNREVIFECLCQRCTETVRNYIDHIGKDLKNKSPQPGAKKKAAPKAASPKGEKKA